jgi:hypothetical protein
MYKDDFDKLNLEKDSLQTAINILEAKYWALEQAATQEMDGTGGSGYRDQGPIYQEKKSNAKNAYTLWQNLKRSNGKEIRRIEKEINELEKTKEEKIKNAERKAEKLDGLLERIKLAHEIAGFWVSLFITLLFMVIELTPIFFKMMLIKGPYDFMDENVKELARAEAGVEIIYNYYHSKDELNNAKGDLSSADIKKNNVGGYEVHKVINHAADLKAKERLLIIKAQEELNEQIIEKWKQKKSREIDENPDNFVSES